MEYILGIFSHDEVTDGKEKDKGLLQPISEGDFTLEDLQGEVLQFPTNCHCCGSPCHTNMKMTSILKSIYFCLSYFKCLCYVNNFP